MANNKGDSGKFGSDMSRIKRFQNQPIAEQQKQQAARTMGALKGNPRKLQGGKNMPKVKPVQGDTLQNGKIADSEGINQGLFKGNSLKVRNLKTPSGTLRMQR